MVNVITLLLSTDVQYDNAHAHAVICLVVAGFLSGLAVLGVFVTMVTNPSSLSRTQIMPYFVSLMGANVLQSIGAILNVKWVIRRAVEEGSICTAQGAIKQAGNVGAAVWSLVIAICVFNLMFLRAEASKLASYGIFAAGWAFVAFIVIIGPAAVQTPDKGPYFGPSGYWCWITTDYPAERTFLEYFFEFFSAGISFVLYIAILLRVRGNLIHSNDGWHLRFVPRSERWVLAISRDWLDSTMMRIAALFVLYPVTYIILLLPVAIVRFVEFGGKNVPFGIIIVADTLFNLQGLANAVLLFSTRRLAPMSNGMSGFAATPRKVMNLSSPEAAGITPFTLATPHSEDPPELVTTPHSYTDTFSMTMSLATPTDTESFISSTSQTPLNHRRRMSEGIRDPHRTA